MRVLLLDTEREDLRRMEKEDVVMYNGILLSYKKKEIMPFAATWMQLEIIIQSRESQKDKDKWHTISLICGIQNMKQLNLFMNQKQNQRQTE